VVHDRRLESEDGAGELTLLDLVCWTEPEAFDHVVQLNARETLDKLMTCLTDQERELISNLSRADGKTRTEVRKEWGVTRQRAEQVYKKAFRKMRAKADTWGIYAPE